MSFNKKNITNTKKGFVNKCLFVLIDGYNAMKGAKRYFIDWEEEDLTAQLIHYSENTTLCKKWRIEFDAEHRIYDDEIIFGNKKAKKAKRIDVKMTSWQKKEKEIYFIEAKNICENDWVKETGAKVSSSYQLNRYADTGVSHFLSNYYPNGCLCGYILNGNSKNTIGKLNKILAKKNFNKLEISEPVNKHELIYTIQQNNYNLINLFFEF